MPLDKLFNHPHKPMACAECGNTDKLVLHSRCHPSDPTWVVLDGNKLLIECSVCEKPITSFVITEEK